MDLGELLVWNGGESFSEHSISVLGQWIIARTSKSEYQFRFYLISCGAQREVTKATGLLWIQLLVRFLPLFSYGFNSSLPKFFYCFRVGRFERFEGF